MLHGETGVLRASVFCLMAALVSAAGAFAQSRGQTLYNGITLPPQWPPSESPTQVYQLPSYITNPPPLIFIDIGRQLFVDDFLIQQTTMTRTQHQPVMYPANPIIAPGPSGYQFLMPFSDGAWFDPSDQLFKIWLYCGGATGSGICYEYSTDGKNWISPSIPDAAVPNTNIVLLQGGLVVWMDLQDIPARKFKAFIYMPGGTYQVALYFSADGIHWTGTSGTQYPIPLVYDRTTVFWNPFRNVWVDSMKDYLTLPSAPTRGGYLTRARNYAESPDLMNWTPGEPANPSDPALLANSYWTGPDVNDPPYVPGGVPPQLYNLDAVAYESVVVGLFSWFYPGPAENDPFDLPGPDLVELGVGFSRDGFQWVRPTRGSGPGPGGALIPASNIPGTWNMGNTQSAGGCFLVVGDELWFYFSGRTGPHADPNVTGATGLATLRRDGFYSMDAGSTQATLTTRPVQFSGKYMFVNVKDPQGSLSIQVLNPSTGAVLATSSSLSVDKTLQQVTSWTDPNGNALTDLSEFAGGPVEFKFALTNGELYSFWVSASTSGASSGYVAAGGPGFTGLQDNLGSVAYPTTVATPEISPAGEVFPSSVTVSIFTGTLGSTIYYTLDGSPPTTSSPVYTGPFALTTTAAVQATASAPKLTNSPIASAVFTMDNVPPTVSISFPQNGTTVSASATLSATASDNVGVASVEFLIDGTGVGTVTTPPYTMTVETTTLINTTHQLTAIATDLAGNQAMSAPITMLVQNVLTGPSAGLVGYWSFDSQYVSGTTLFDQSGNNNNGAASNIILVPGAVNQGILFNGSSSSVQVATNSPSSLYDLTGDLTMSLWVQTSNSSRYEVLLSKLPASGSSCGYLLRTNPAGTTELLFGSANVASGAALATDVTRINDGGWHNLAIVVSLGKTVVFYVDGAFSSSVAINSAAAVCSSSLEMGLSPTATNGTYLTGKMDEVRIYSRALSLAEVLQLAGTVWVTPLNVILGPAQSQQFFGRVQGAPGQTVNWSISPALGTISATGLYIAPSPISTSQTVIVTATNAANSAQFISTTVTLTSGAAVNFLGADSTSQGNWSGAYGADGYSVSQDSQRLPVYATFAVQNALGWVWGATTSDPRGLLTGSQTGRIAAAWWSTGTFNFDLNIVDGNLHPFAIYLLDWDNQGRSELVQILDANTQAVLDSRSISGFVNGIYLQWNISGHVTITVTPTGGPNAVVSGVFFGGSVGGNSESIAASSGTPQSAITNTAFAPLSATVLSGGNPLASALVTFTAPGNGASGSFPGGAISAMATTNAAGVATAPAFTANGTTGGPYAVMATVPGVATPATFLLTNTMAGGSSNSATYLFQDTSTQGNWQSKYGSDGSLIAGVPQQNIPYYASVAVENQQNWTWATNSSDPRALQVPGSSGIAAAWYSSSSFSLDLKLTGGSAHQVALYVLDWDTKGRAETIKVVDGDTGATLDTRNIPGSNTSTTGASFVGGTYLAWNISGHVTITVTCNGGPNAVVSGVFFGGGAQASPTFSSASGTTFAVGAPGTFLVTTTGTPVAALTQTTGTLPGGVSFTDNGNGTATLGGTPMAGTGGTYNLSFMAANGVGTNPVQNFMLTVVSPAAPASTSANNVTFTVGTPGTFTVTTTGTPAAALTKTTGTLPGGVSFTDNGNGTATLGGTPMANTGGVYNLTITASNGVGSPAVQNFTLTVDQAPAITSAASTTFTAGTLGTFTVTAAGFPVPMFGESGSLPGGVMFTDNGNGTATLSGTPATNSSSPYSVTITASNGVSPGATQTFILTVNLQGANPGPAAAFVSADTATQGSWMGVYGGDGYDVADGPQSPAGGQLSYGSYSVQNQTTWMWAASTSDTRGLQADSQGDRIAATWYGNTTFRFDVNLTGTHRVALYVLDWDSKGRGETVTVLDASNPGAPALDSRSIPNANSSSATNTNTTGANFVNGTYLVWNISGHVTITVTANSGPNAVVAGIFFGGAGTITPPPVAAASWVKADTATEGTWMGVYGSQGYSLATGGQNIQNISIPATFTVQSQSNWAWAASTTDTRALQTDSQGDRTAATWYSGSGFSLNLNLADGQTHQVAVYVIDWDNKGRGETISIADANSGKMLDARSIPNTNASSPADTNTTASNFLNGTYLVWNISGSVTLTITPNSGPNAVISAVFLDP